MKNLASKLKEQPINGPKKFVGRLFELRDVTHKEHLKVKSYAQHVALGELYDGILSLADGFVESYQGKYGIIDISIGSINVIDYMEYIEEFAKYVEGSREIFKEDWLKNQIDEMAALIYSTIYKLKFLK
jgi:hypothetical protein